MNSQITITDPATGTTHQNIDTENPPTLEELSKVVGGTMGTNSASLFIQNASGDKTPVSRSHRVQVNDHIVVAHQTKAGGQG